MNDALIACVKALGGSKVVGPRLFPEKAPDVAQRTLLDCLNEDRPNKLSPDQVMAVLRWARAIGFHAGMDWVCSDAGYSAPQPIEPRDELADLLRQYVARRDADAAKDARLERLLSQYLQPRAA